MSRRSDHSSPVVIMKLDQTSSEPDRLVHEFKTQRDGWTETTKREEESWKLEKGDRASTRPEGPPTGNTLRFRGHRAPGPPQPAWPAGLWGG